MKTKSLKIIKLSFSLLSFAIFFFSLTLLGDSEYTMNFFGLYIGQFSFYFLLSLIIVSVLEIANYFSMKEIFNKAANLIVILTVVYFILNLFSDIRYYGGMNLYLSINLVVLLPILILCAIFLLDRKFKLNRKM